MVAEARSLQNPWLDIPAGEYEAHMGPGHADQLSPLGAIFAETLRAVRPARVALLGCATGNGLEHIDPAITRQVVAVDINPSYVAIARDRHRAQGAILDARCADLLACDLGAGGFDLVHAALVFEHVDAAALAARAAAWVAPAGTLSVVLQLEGGAAPVTPSPYGSIAALAGTIRLVTPAALAALLAPHGLTLRQRRTVPVKNGKRFEVCLFGR